MAWRCFECGDEYETRVDWCATLPGWIDTRLIFRAVSHPSDQYADPELRNAPGAFSDVAIAETIANCIREHFPSPPDLRHFLGSVLPPPL